MYKTGLTRQGNKMPTEETIVEILEKHPALQPQSSQVSVGVGRLQVTFQVFPADKILNPPLYDLDIRLQHRKLNIY
jgi:hypothetical protein